MRAAFNGFHAAVLIGVAALATTTLTATALIWPGGTSARLLNLAPSHEALASAAIATPEPTAADLATAQRETMRSLAQAPANPTAWLRLAYIDSRDTDGLGPAGIDALNTSYDAAPYGPDDTPWRLAFAFNHWSRLDRAARLLALEELRVALAIRLATGREIAENVSNPAGRVALLLTINEAERVQQAAAHSSRG